MDFLRLSLPTMEWLADSRQLSLADASPLGFFAHGKGPSSPAEREAAVARELPGKRVPAPYDEALALLAQPEARIRVLVVEPKEAPVPMAVFARAGRASLFYFDREAFHIGAPMGVTEVLAKLARQLEGPESLEGQTEIYLWPGVLAVLVALWPGTDRAIDAPLPRSEALSRLGPEGEGKAKAEASLDELVRNGVLKAANGDLSIDPRYRPWLELAWSGHFVQVEYLTLPAAGQPLEGLKEKTQHLLFAGPPGRRVLSRTVEGQELAKRLKGVAPPEPRVVHLSVLSPEARDLLLRALLRLEQQPAAQA